MRFPRQHRSAFELLGELEGAATGRLDQETPLFAASRAFAQEVGGPLTRAFLAALPSAPDELVVIDSSLVWLTPGLVHDEDRPGGGAQAPHRAPPCYRHEPFPGHTRGVRGDANRNQSATHLLCVLGLPCTPVVATGDLLLSPAEDPEAFWLAADLQARDQRLRRWIAEGQLVEAPLPLNTLVRFGWGTFRCPRPAERPGFQLILHATLGDPRPHANGIRNVSFI